jgi:rfaE bifunctional protein kinase chain/domain
MKITANERAALLAVLERFEGQGVVLWGDLVADEFVEGEITRVSREAPVLILKQRQKRIVPGGGANAAANLADLGAMVVPVGAAGDDEPGEALVRYFRERNILTRHILRMKTYCTPTKSRILGVVGHGRPQQIVRVDREPSRLDVAVRGRLAASVSASLDRCSAVAVSDYGYGATSATEVNSLCKPSARGRAVVWTVDSRYDLLTYTQLTAATPNEPEIEAAFQRKIGDNLDVLHELGFQVLKRQRLQSLLITRGRKGMVLFERRLKPRYLPIFGSDQVTDVTGAGDTVMATFTLALAAGAVPLLAAMVANVAGGLKVMKSGTATVSRRELEEAIRNA